MNSVLRFVPILVLLIGLAYGQSAEAKSAQKIPFHLQQKDSGPALSPSQVNSQVENLLIQGTNQNRKKKGLASLTFNATLKKAGLTHSRDMLNRNYLSHFSPEGNTVKDRLEKLVGEIRTPIGENIHTIKSSQGFRDPQAIASVMISDWMGSPSHRKNILSKNFTQIGIGCANNGAQIYCTQVFSGPNLK